MMKYLLLICSVAVLCSGCASILTNQGMQTPMSLELKDGRTVYMGVDVFNIQTALEHPFATIAAAAIDGAILYVAWDTLDHYLNADDAPATPTMQYVGEVYIINTRDGSPISISRDNAEMAE